MSCPCRAPALAAVVTLALVAGGCQDYNFNPVGHCLIQPGTERFTLSNIATADMLFVVDDSGSMQGEQGRLASAFATFVAYLTDTNTARKAVGLEPIDFHIAVTTTSVYWNEQTSQTCSSTCVPGRQVCCIGTTPVKQPRKCTANSQCAGLGTDGVCRTTCTGFKGEGYCCNPDNSFPPSAIADFIPCSRAGIPCGKLETHYSYAGACASGSGLGIAPLENGWPYPHGSFVGITTPTVNPRVLHFDKRLYKASDGRNAQGFTQSELLTFFEDNVKVGICGSGEEQGLQAAKLALQGALAGTQRDTYDFDYARSLTSTSTSGSTLQWDAATRTAGAAARWPTPISNSKLVLVFVGDEDDCSSPEDPSGGVVMGSEAPGNDACTNDASGLKKQLSVSSFVDYFSGLGRPMGAAFIVSARSAEFDNACSGDACFSAICCDWTCTGGSACAGGVCGGQAPGKRFIEAATALKGRGADTVVGSICDPNFGNILKDIAKIVVPPDTLTLPTVPAESRIALLRIVSPNGDTRKLCRAPLAPTSPNYTLDQARNTGADWWFVDTNKADPPAFDPVAAASSVPFPTRYVYINPKGSCIANPGESWSADYLGMVPAGGCASADECAEKLGGQPGAWECFVPPGLTRGTCTCAGTQ